MKKPPSRRRRRRTLDRERQVIPKAPSSALTFREERFVAEYAYEPNGLRAARLAGYKEGPGLAVTPTRLLESARVQAALAKEIDRLKDRNLASKERTIAELSRLAFEPVPNLGELYDAEGNLKPISKLTLEQQRYLQSSETVIKNVAAGDGHTDTVLKVKVIDNRRSKIAALELLVDILGLRYEEGLEPPVDVPAFALPPGTDGVNVH